MTVWRMAFRRGSQGQEMWPACVKFGVAAITYRSLLTTDLSQYPEGEPRELWSRLAPSRIASLRCVAYKMKRGDVIYVKQGTQIIGRGTVRGSYKFDRASRIIDEAGLVWPHQVPVSWERGFTPVHLVLGADQLTVLELSGDRLRRLQAAVRAAERKEDGLSALEGAKERKEAAFRKRNRALIEDKKRKSDGRCEVCGFSFAQRYRSLGRDCLVAHHIKPIGRRARATRTTPDDIALLCPNCHAAVHAVAPPLPLDRLRERLSKLRWHGTRFA